MNVCPCAEYHGLTVCTCHKNEWFCICQDVCKPTKEYEYNKRRKVK